jgi:hypothetical protein
MVAGLKSGGSRAATAVGVMLCSLMRTTPLNDRMHKAVESLAAELEAFYRSTMDDI